MPFYFRKSVSAGPFRFNFSKGGIGLSVGVKGLRIGTGPRGHYVHAGANGIYYRATLGRVGVRASARGRSVPPPLPSDNRTDGVDMIEIDSAEVLTLRDETLGSLLDAINDTRRATSLALVLGCVTAVPVALALAAAGTAALLALPLPFAGIAFGAWLDSYKRRTVLFYDLAPDAQSAYEALCDGFDRLAGCNRKWHVAAAGEIRDLTTWKRNAGATSLVRKSVTELSYKLPRTIACNLTPPAIHVGRQILFFLPDAVFIDDGRHLGAVRYERLAAHSERSDFIEEGTVPADAQIIRYTWQHPNKSGGPDRRFAQNRQIPVCLYETLRFSSPEGMNELLEFSKAGVTIAFCEALHRIGRVASRRPAARTSKLLRDRDSHPE